MSLKDLVTNAPKTPNTGRQYVSKLILPSDKPIRIRPIMGSYTYFDGTTKEVYAYFKHFNATTNSAHICSSKWEITKDNRLERVPGSRCVGCHLVFQERARNVQLTKHYGMSVYVCDDFHLDPLDYQGKPLGVDEEGKPKKRKILCTGDSCIGCKTGLETTWGRKMLWELPRTHLETLVTIVQSVSTTCANCGNGPDRNTDEGGLTIIGVKCPSCGAPASFRTQADAKQLVAGPTICGSCRKMVTFVEELFCPCGHPRRPSLFDMDVWAIVQGKPSKLIITDKRIGPPMPRLQPDDLKPMNLPELLSPPPIELQCKTHGVPNPFISTQDLVEDYR